MTRRLPISVYKRINTQSFKSNPYIRNKINNDQFLSQNNEESHNKHYFKTGLTSHPSVKIHPVIEYSLISNNLLTRLNEIQESSYLSITSGKDVTIHSPTGTGKTIAYLLPILNNVYYIHDMLERLIFKNDSNTPESDIRLRNLSIARNNKIGHSLLPSRMSHYRQDLYDLESFGKDLFERYKGGTTIDKLLDVLYLQEPKNMKLLNLPNVPVNIWMKRSKNSIYRNIMSNPLGSVRCVVILVPNKDLVSQVVSYIDKIDILGRVSVQTLTRIPMIPSTPHIFSSSETYDPRDSDALINIDPNTNQKVEIVNNEQINNKQNNLEEKKVVEDYGTNQKPNNENDDLNQNQKNNKIQLNKIGENRMFYEDEMKMIENVPVKQVDDKEIETVSVNMGNRINKIKIKLLGKQEYSIDGLVPESIKYRKQPILTSDTIQWGSVDIVVSTVQSFAFEIMNCSRKGIYPVSVIFDEVDMLFENNAHRSSIFEIISRLRPRPPTYNPLIHFNKRSSKTPPPVQIINVGSTINFGGIQTCGNMLFERFNTSKLVFGDDNHVIKSDLHFEKSDPDKKLSTLVRVILNNPFKKTIIYCNSLENCRFIYQTLRKYEWPVMSFHSRSALATRLAILKTFEDDEPRILVATDLVTRGINIKVDHIINYDFPTTSSVFFHRIKTSDAKVTNIVTEESELTSQIVHFASVKKPISQILSRKRSFRKKLDRIKFEKIAKKNESSTRKTEISYRKRENKFRTKDRTHTTDETKNRKEEPRFKTEETHLNMNESSSSKDNNVGERGFFESKFVINKNIEGESKYRRVPIKKRLYGLFNNYN